MNPPSTHAERHGFEIAQESDRIQSRTVGLVLVMGVIVTVISVLLTAWILRWMVHGLRTETTAAAKVAPRQIAAIHQTLIERDRHGWEQREQQRRVLEQYRWLDRKQGTAQIPIDRAIELVVRDASRPKGAPP